MSGGSRTSAGRPRIDFRVHQLRHGDGGAPYDFENMLAALIQATLGEAHLAFTHRGDWGIDVLRGDLNGKVTVWQAKYFLKVVGAGQLAKIEKSLISAINYSKQHGYHIDEWILCLPTSMTPAMYQKWQTEIVPIGRGENIAIKLWDETQLADLLHKDAAAHVRMAYYEPYAASPLRTDEPRLRIRPAEPDRTAWQGGQEIRLGVDRYLIHAPVTEWPQPGGQASIMRATAARLGGEQKLLVLQGICARRGRERTEEVRAGLEVQAGLLREIDGRHCVPRLVAIYDEEDLFTLASERPTGATWAEMFGAGEASLDRLVVPMAASAAGSVCEGLDELHRLGHSHRALDAQSIVVGHRNGRGGAALRDVGLAGLPEPAGETWLRFRAPEQRALALGPPGSATDVYLLAALFLHTLTGVTMSSVVMPPVLPHDFPPQARDLFSRALNPDPRLRPGIRELSGVLRGFNWYPAEAQR